MVLIWRAKSAGRIRSTPTPAVAPSAWVIVTYRVDVSRHRQPRGPVADDLDAVEVVAAAVDGHQVHGVVHVPRLDLLRNRHDQAELADVDQQRLGRQCRRADGADERQGRGRVDQQRVDVLARDGQHELERRAALGATGRGRGQGEARTAATSSRPCAR